MAILAKGKIAGGKMLFQVEDDGVIFYRTNPQVSGWLRLTRQSLLPQNAEGKKARNIYHKITSALIRVRDKDVAVNATVKVIKYYNNAASI